MGTTAEPGVRERSIPDSDQKPPLPTPVYWSVLGKKFKRQCTLMAAGPFRSRSSQKSRQKLRTSHLCQHPCGHAFMRCGMGWDGMLTNNQQIKLIGAVIPNNIETCVTIN